MRLPAVPILARQPLKDSPLRNSIERIDGTHALVHSQRRVTKENDKNNKNVVFFQTDIQAPLNRQIIQSSETVMYLVKLANNFLDYFSGGSGTKVKGGNDLGSTDNMPRYT